MDSSPPDSEPHRGPAWRFAWLVVRLRWPIVVAWAIAAVLLTIKLPSIEEAQSGALGDLVPTNSEALDAELRSNELFRFPLLSRTLVVQRDSRGLSAVQQASAVSRGVALNQHRYPELRRVGGALVVSNSLGKPPFSRERSTTAITYLFFRPDVSPGDREILADRLIDRHIKPDYGGFVGVTGAVAARSAQSAEIEDALPLVELGTVLLVLLVVGLHFRAIGAPLATLLAVGVAYLVSIRLIAAIGQRLGVSVPSEVQPVIVVLLFGVVTDYSVFFLSRIRSRLADGEDARTAAIEGTAELLPIILTAGITVVAASAALVFAKLGFYQAFGPGTAMSVLVGLMVSVTLIPALLAIGGRALFWPHRPGPGDQEQAGEEPPGEQARRSRAIRVATERPLATALVVGGLLLIMATGALHTELGNPLIRGLPRASNTREAYTQASRGFAPGILSPTVLFVERHGVTRQRKRLVRFQRILARQPGVAQVVGPANQPVDRAFGGVYSQTHNAARFFVVLRSDPLGAGAIGALRRIQDRLPRMLVLSGLPSARASVSGDTAIVAETVAGTRADLVRIAPVCLAVVLIVLIAFLGALVAPLYLVAASVLGLFASLGLATYLFQDWLHYGELAFYVPFATAVLLVSLGSDYNVFLVGRIWSEARLRPLRSAVATAGTLAATPITIAGLVLSASFALLALVPLRPFRELAFTMGVGLLLDAFLIRTLLVPALICLVGERSAWPGRRLRSNPRHPLPRAPRTAAVTSRLKNRALDLSRSLGAVPGLIVVVFAALGIGLVELDRHANIGHTHWVFQGDPAAARTVLSVIAGSLITVAGLTFSMTMVALHLASSQFSPRVLRTFFGDRITQVTIGTYVGVFVYAVLVLRAVGFYGTGGFVPRLSVTAATLLGIGAVVLVVVFLSHVSQLIQVSHVTAAIARDTLARIDKLLPDPFEDAADDHAAELLDEWREEPSATVLAGHPGYVQRLGLEDLTESLPPSVERVAVVVCPGDFVGIDIAIAEIWPADAVDACRSPVLDAVSVTPERDLSQDVDFGVRQLTDIALKAVSPGINDPATAVTCISYLRSILVRVTERAPQPRLHLYPERGLTVIVRHREYHEYFEPLEQINRYVGPDAWVVDEMLQALAACARAARRHGGNARADTVRDVVATVQERAHSEVVHRRDRRQINATVAAIDREAEEPLPHPGGLGKNS